MHDATIYRDENYGMLALIPLAGDRLGLMEHRFRDLETALAILGEHGRDAWQPERAHLGQWVLREHVDVTLARVAAILRREGYSSDVLAERAFYQLPVSEDFAIDAPVPGSALLAEDAARAIRALVREGLGGQAPDDGAIGLHAFPCSRAKGAPFVRARAALGEECFAVLTERALRARLREALGASLVRATVRPQGAYFVAEVGIRPSRALLEAWAGKPLPALQAAPPGLRGVRFGLGVPIASSALGSLQERAQKAGAVRSLELREGAIYALVPSEGPGDHLADPALRERTAWLAEALEPWRPSLEEITDAL